MLAETIRSIHAASRGCYGVRRMHPELTIGMAIEVGSGKVRSIMKHLGVQQSSQRPDYEASIKAAKRSAGVSQSRNFVEGR